MSWKPIPLLISFQFLDHIIFAQLKHYYFDQHRGLVRSTTYPGTTLVHLHGMLAYIFTGIIRVQNYSVLQKFLRKHKQAHMEIIPTQCLSKFQRMLTLYATQDKIISTEQKCYDRLRINVLKRNMLPIPLLFYPLSACRCWTYFKHHA